MMRIPALLAAALFALAAQAQTFFYIDQINVVPNPATTSDDVQVQLAGSLSSTGAYIVSAQATVTGSLVALTVVAADNGGLTVLVLHTESISLGQLPAGDYTIAFTLASFGVLDLAPAQQRSFTVLGGVAPCDQLEIASVQWHAFTDTAIVVHVQNNGPVGFDYPGFILFDASGDTLAKETVSFFALAGDSWHVLRVMDGATIPSTPFTGALELWTGFTTELACSWAMAFELCPPPPCAPVLLTLGNFGPLPAFGSFSWTLMDATSTTVASGIFGLGGGSQFIQAEQCLEPGEYVFVVAPLGPPSLGSDIRFGVSSPGGLSSPSQPVSWSLPVPLNFSFYAPCTDGINVIAPKPARGLRIMQQDRMVSVERADGLPLGLLEAFDAQGRLLHRSTAMSHRSLLRIDAPGVILLRVAGHSERAAVE